MMDDNGRRPKHYHQQLQQQVFPRIHGTNLSIAPHLRRRRRRQRSSGRHTVISIVERLLFLLVILTGIGMAYVNTVLWNKEQERAAGATTRSSFFDTKDAAVVGKHDNTTSSSPTSKEKNVEPILRILHHANLSEADATDPAFWEELPDWDHDVVKRFGNGPVILGLERCAAYNARVPFTKDRMVASAGPFNSGTNFLHELLHENCHIPYTKNGRTGVLWQVPWGKHQSPRFRFENVARGMSRQGSNAANTLPVVLVRDPYSWFQSMCKVRYAAHWYHIVPDHCPNFIATQIEQEWFTKTKAQVKEHYQNDVWKVDNVMEKANYTLDSTVIPLWVRYKSEIRNHESLAHMWRDWYEEYYQVSWPRLMVRLEDLVFYPHETLRRVCECVEGTYVGDDKLSLVLDSAKARDDKIHGTDRTGLVRAMISHATQNRTRGMTVDDAAFARTTLKDSVMDVFGYKPPP